MSPSWRICSPVTLSAIAGAPSPGRPRSLCGVPYSLASDHVEAASRRNAANHLSRLTIAVLRASSQDLVRLVGREHVEAALNAAPPTFGENSVSSQSVAGPNEGLSKSKARSHSALAELTAIAIGTIWRRGTAAA